ncbi:MAG TPA: NAD(P)-binding domain-containing protein [Candidatus Eisenbacteria bacterium]|nr:NAD(P)-binding domain-containing protein [Candidatus Eisenbacteria bacterium]
MSSASIPSEPFEVIVIGGGQAGLSVGYHLARLGIPFVIFDERPRIGDAWRERWDSLRLFTPARFDGLDGMPFPAPPFSFPTKNEMADYLEAYAKRFGLPVRTGTRVERLTRVNDRYQVTAGDRTYEAPHVIVAMATYQQPRVPDFASSLDPTIVQLHSADYRKPSQLPPGGALVVGAGNSGVEVAMDLVRDGRRVWVSGRDVGEIPFKISDPVAVRTLAPLVFRFVFHRVLTMDTPMGRRARPSFITRGTPLIRTRQSDLRAAGVMRVPRTARVVDGKPALDDGTVLDVAGVVWCTGFHLGPKWLEVPVFGSDGEPRQTRGVVPGEPGFYFVGPHYLYSVSSTMIHGVGRDAKFVAEAIASRRRETVAA